MASEELRRVEEIFYDVSLTKPLVAALIPCATDTQKEQPQYWRCSESELLSNDEAHKVKARECGCEIVVRLVLLLLKLHLHLH